MLNFDPNNIVVFGAETKRDFADESSDPRVESIRTNGFYAEYQATPLEPLTLTLGARLDDNQRFGDYATWRATGAYNIESTGTKAEGELCHRLPRAEPVRTVRHLLRRPRSGQSEPVAGKEPQLGHRDRAAAAVRLAPAGRKRISGWTRST